MTDVAPARMCLALMMAASDAETLNMATLAHRQRRPTVLFIENNLTQLDLYLMMLEHDFDILQATRGEQGYDLACRHLPDAIVMDVLLPDVDGLEVMARLRANLATESIPIVILTADEAAYARAQVVRSALTAALMKPCPADRLLAVLNDAVKHHALAARGDTG